MTIPVKTKKEVRIMTKGGRRLARILTKILANISPGMKLADLDQLAKRLIEKEGGQPSFKMVPNYYWATCININDGIVHGIPGDYQIKNNDLVSVDLGILYQGFHTDMARTVIAQNTKCKTKNEELESFLEAGQEALKTATEVAETGNRVGHISQAIEEELKKSGFYPVTSLTGHGVGRKLHESPVIPCFLKGKIEESPLLKPGMTLAIEVIYTQRKTGIRVEKDNWTVKTKDGSLAGLFENTVLITPKETRVLTELSLN